MSTESITLETVKTSIVEIWKNVGEISKKVDGAFNESQTGLSEIQQIADSLSKLGPKASSFGDRLLKALEKSAAILDLDSSSASLEESRVAIKATYANVVALLRAEEEKYQQVNEVLSQVQASAERYQLHIARPQSELFGSTEENSSDVFNTVNNPDSVKSRIKFIRALNKKVVGVAVVSANTSSRSITNYFYFINYLEQCELLLGRSLEIGEGPDGVFVYRQAMQIAVALADALVTQFGSLDDDLLDSGSQSESAECSTDEVGDLEPSNITVDEDEDFSEETSEETNAGQDNEPNDLMGVITDLSDESTEESIELENADTVGEVAEVFSET